MFNSKFLGLKVFLFIYSFIAAAFLTADRSEATSIVVPVDHFILGDNGIQPLFPLGVVTIADIGVDTVQVNVDLTPGVVKYVTLGLLLSPVINESQLTLNALSGDRMTLSTGGWLSYFSLKVNFLDKPNNPVAFTLNAPGLDATDFLFTPSHIKYDGSIFAINLWYLQSVGMLDSTVGGNSPTIVPAGVVPEPLTSLLLGSGLAGLGLRRSKKYLNTGLFALLAVVGSSASDAAAQDLGCFVSRATLDANNAQSFCSQGQTVQCGLGEFGSHEQHVAAFGVDLAATCDDLNETYLSALKCADALKESQNQVNIQFANSLGNSDRFEVCRAQSQGYQSLIQKLRNRCGKKCRKIR